MSGIAEVLHNQGYPVSGSDLAESDTTRRLAQLGIRISIGHRAENLQHAKAVVISSAVRPENPEVIEARHRRVPVIPRAEMLAEIMRGKQAIAVAGSHGKTTTTSMIATVLTHAGLDPTLVIGGKVDSLGGNAKLGQGQFVVAEADESDGSFLQLPTVWGVVTNIDNDHLDYYESLQAIESAFSLFVCQLPFYGAAAVCLDDPGVQRCLSRFTKPVLTYGISTDADFRAKNITALEMGSRFEVMERGQSLGKFEIQVPGQHNILNALAAIAIARELGVSVEEIRTGIHAFAGVKRRFEICWKNTARKQVIVDDYGHHPTEIASTLSAAKSFWKGRIRVVFQPHRYTRTLHCHDGFLSAFHHADEIILTEIYAAGEEPIEGVSGEQLCKDISNVLSDNQKIRFAKNLDVAKKYILDDFKDGDLVICMGAGTITRLPSQLVSHHEK